MSRVWIDLTDIKDWQGQHGGVQRVVYGIASRYFKDDKEDVGFFVFDAKTSAFYESDFKDIYDRVEQAHKSALLHHTPSLSVESKAKLKLRQHIPNRLLENDKLRKGAKKVARRVLKTARYTKSALVSRPTGFRRVQQLRFSSEDTVLILGKPWDNVNIQKTLSKMKQRDGFRLVQIVYDMIIPLYPHLHHNSLFRQYTQHMFEVVAASDLLLPISKSSEQDLLIFSKRLNLPTPKTKVVRLGDDVYSQVNADSPTKKPDDRVADTFLLCVGTIEIRKNLTLLYYVYKLAAEQGVELPQMVIVGGRGWLSHDIQYLIKNDPGVKQKILLLNNISDSGLDWLYRNCALTVYPSMYEGWGLPIAESLNYGKMCISSSTSSMQEIAGDLIDYFSPYDAADCLEKVVRFLDEDKRMSYERRINKEYKRTSWEETFRQIKLFIKTELYR